MSDSKVIDTKMHSSEHILNQTMAKRFGCERCFSAHIEKKKSKCDYRFGRDLTRAEAAEIENTVNEVIGRNLPVTEEFLDKAVALNKYNLERLPADSGDTVRIIHIGDYDACPCRGPHVAATGEIGRFNIISHDFAEGVLRIRYKLA